MKSRSKTVMDTADVVRLFAHAGIEGAAHVVPLGAGEYNAIYAAEAGGKAYVVKIAPADAARTLTYETDMMRQEVRYYSLMRDRAGIRVPEIYSADFAGTVIPSAYFIMERLEGSQLDRAELTDAERAEAARKTAAMVARMHSVRGEKYGYAQNGLHDDWHRALVAMITNLIRDARRFGRGCRNGHRLLRHVERHQALLAKVECRLINFDVWPSNIICRRGKDGLELAWIDPERCFFGDRIADFVCLDFMNMSLDHKETTIAAYNRESDAPIVVTDAERIRFAIMLGYLGLIMEVEKYARYTPFHFGWWRNVGACRLLYRHCFGPLKALSGRAGVASRLHG